MLDPQSAPVVAADGDGRLEVFVFDSEGQLWRIGQTQWSNGWSGWALQGGPWAGRLWPTVAPNGDGRLELFVAADSGSVQHQSQTAWSGGWPGSWSALGPPLPSGRRAIGQVGAAPNADGRLEVFAANGELWRLEQASWSNGWASSWVGHGTPQGAEVAGPVAAARSGDGLVCAFVRDTAGNMWNVMQTEPAGAWSDWNLFGTVDRGVADHPALARNADGRLALFALGSHTLWTLAQTQVSPSATWSEWTSLGGAGAHLANYPVVGSNADGRLEIFMTGSAASIVDWSIWCNPQTAASGSWAGWTSLGSAGGGFLLAAPGLGRNGDGRLELFAVGADGNLWHNWQTAASSDNWSGWASLQQPGITTVPDLLNDPVKVAVDRVIAAHLTPVPATGPQDSWVAGQNPDPNTSVPEGSTVTLTLQTGPIR
jgi:hypothetical protein